jgi:hypothetical protein
MRRWKEGEYINLQDIIDINTSESTIPLPFHFLSQVQTNGHKSHHTKNKTHTQLRE